MLRDSIETIISSYNSGFLKKRTASDGLIVKGGGTLGQLGFNNLK